MKLGLCGLMIELCTDEIMTHEEREYMEDTIFLVAGKRRFYRIKLFRRSYYIENLGGGFKKSPIIRKTGYLYKPGRKAPRKRLLRKIIKRYQD